jgi:hypothetical protein
MIKLSEKEKFENDVAESHRTGCVTPAHLIPYDCSPYTADGMCYKLYHDPEVHTQEQVEEVGLYLLQKCDAAKVLVKLKPES